jgi:hypothetical protein
MVGRAVIAGCMCFGLISGAYAATEQFHATMNAASEVPPTNSRGSGEAQATLNTTTHQLTYNVTFQGLSSPPTMAHFHGPAPAGKNAGIQIWLSEKGAAPTSPMKGTVTLTPQQQQQLEAGMWYVNVHTHAHPSGAIRGQLEPAK